MKDNRLKYFDKYIGYDYILEINEGKNFIEIVSSMGGDVITSRVYGDKNGKSDSFTITER